MKISCYITSYKINSLSKDAVNDIKECIQPYEISIVDDSSTDGSQDLIY